MSQGLKLRVLLNERLTAVAEEIFQLFERTIAEYQEELLGANGGSHSRTQTLESAVEEDETRSRRAGIQIISSCQREDGPMKQENPVQIYIKEDPDLCIKQEDEDFLPFTVVSVKVDEEHINSVYQQTEEKIGIIRSTNEQTGFDSGSEETTTPANSSVQRMEIEGHHSNALLMIGTNGPPRGVGPQAVYFSGTTGSVSNVDKRHLTNSSLTDSEKGHKLHKCAQCGKEYQHSSSLFRHIHTHREQKPFRCSVCQKGFSQKPHLTAHMRIHTGEKPFSCPFCARTFSNKSNLSQHLRVHTGEKPFACGVCNMHFSCLKTHTTHMRIHTGGRPFECLECGMRFKQQMGLDSHMKTHSGEQSYS